MKKSWNYFAQWMLLFLAAWGVTGEPLRSGLSVGETLPGSFEPFNVNGEYAGRRHCLVCENGLNPVVMIFARKDGEELEHLLGQLDKAAEEHKAASLGAFVVFLGDRDELEKPIGEAAARGKFKHVVLSIDDLPGPEGYKVSERAEVTVVLYTRSRVKANFAFGKGGLDAKAVERIVADIPLILPAR